MINIPMQGLAAYLRVQAKGCGPNEAELLCRLASEVEAAQAAMAGAVPANKPAYQDEGTRIVGDSPERRAAEARANQAGLEYLFAHPAPKGEAPQKLEHVCGLQGYNGMIDPPCPACEVNRAAWDRARALVADGVTQPIGAGIVQKQIPMGATAAGVAPIHEGKQ